MGCWNETCMISHLPIRAGERVLTVFLLENPFDTIACYSTCDWTPLFALYGVYDGYGCIEQIKYPELAQSILQELTKKQADFFSVDGTLTTQENKAKHEKETNIIMPDTMEEFIASLDEHFVLNSKLPRSNTKPYQHIAKVFIKESVWEELVKSFKKDEDGMILNYEIEYAVKDFLKKSESWMNYQPKDKDDLHALFFLSEMYDSLSKLLSFQLNNARQAFLQVFFNQFMRSAAKSPVYAAEMIQLLGQLSLILDSLRMTWHRPSGTGSQNRKNSIMKCLSHIISKNL